MEEHVFSSLGNQNKYSLLVSRYMVDRVVYNSVIVNSKKLNGKLHTYVHVKKFKKGFLESIRPFSLDKCIPTFLYGTIQFGKIILRYLQGTFPNSGVRKITNLSSFIISPRVFAQKYWFGYGPRKNRKLLFNRFK